MKNYDYEVSFSSTSSTRFRLVTNQHWCPRMAMHGSVLVSRFLIPYSMRSIDIARRNATVPHNSTSPSASACRPVLTPNPFTVSGYPVSNSNSQDPRYRMRSMVSACNLGPGLTHKHRGACIRFLADTRYDTTLPLPSLAATTTTAFSPVFSFRFRPHSESVVSQRADSQRPVSPAIFAPM